MMVVMITMVMLMVMVIVIVMRMALHQILRSISRCANKLSVTV